MSIELPKAYIASDHEPKIHALWKQAEAFKPSGDGTPYCIVMPPPNRTGVLHMGHATMLAIQDTLIRYHRMVGDRVFWVPGSDHAAIATQVKVEQLLKEKGYKDPRRELGRETFLEEVRAFAQTSRDTIVRQVEAMGSSCDWAYEKYTLDEERNRAVFEMFRRMYEDGIIERGYRLVNWDPQFQTTLSDDEVLTKETTAKLYTFRYAKDFPIVISTTRPETKFGDTAVAVHPSDERYAQYIGTTFETSFCGKPLAIQVIGDEAVDPAFGTGALGVTPAHSQIDWEMMERHGLRMEVVIGEDGRLLPACGEGFAGLTIVEAREQIAAHLAQDGLLEKTEDVAQNLPVAERGGAPVEQLPKKQWFVRVNKPFVLRQNTLGVWKKGDRVTLKELMIEAVQSQKADRTQIIPERFEKTYFHWVNNLRDWCISRQIWFGHQIPVWQKDGEAERVSLTSPGEGWVQDPDTLDTWFSAGMWTFSVLGWPDAASVDADGNLQKTGDLALYHPTQVL
ncbi:class I tRNA ligase family protein, partial [Patescibacteria group bacterium]|nr:class I tRNA ligase family protein [Patescibacteria group bacterium]